MSRLLSERLFPETTDALAGAGAAAGWVCLAAVLRGLAMRGGKAADPIVARLVHALAGVGAVTEGVGAAARCFSSGVASADSEAKVALGPLAHAVAKPLWQQRFFAGAAKLLTGAGAPAGLPLLLALAHLLRGAPPNVVASDRQRTVPWAVQCLVAVAAGQARFDPDLVEALLQVPTQALVAEAGRATVEGQLHVLLPALLALTAHRGAALVREAALHCLLLLAAELPYPALHPYAKGVAAAAIAALDDPKRSVRLQAGRCRAAWGAPSA